MPAETDDDLLLRVASADGDAFEELMNRYLDPVHGYAQRMLGMPSAADDVTQDWFLRVWQSAAGRNPAAPARAWIWRIAHNVVIDHLRARRPTVDVTAVELADQRPDPERQQQSKETTEQVQAAIAQLPDRQRAALALVHDQGLSGHQAAEVLDISVDALESLLARARRGLKASLQDVKTVLLE